MQGCVCGGAAARFPGWSLDGLLVGGGRREVLGDPEMGEFSRQRRHLESIGKCEPAQDVVTHSAQGA